MNKILILKWNIKSNMIGVPQTLELPKGAKVLCFKEMNGGFFIWTEQGEHPEAYAVGEFENVEFLLVWTGLSFPSGWTYVGTHVGHALVHHLYMKGK